MMPPLLSALPSCGGAVAPPVLQSAVAAAVAVDVAEVEGIRVGAERPAAAWARRRRVELGEGSGTDPLMSGAVAAGGGGTPSSISAASAARAAAGGGGLATVQAGAKHRWFPSSGEEVGR